jgi:hypothetical protein
MNDERLCSSEATSPLCAYQRNGYARVLSNENSLLYLDSRLSRRSRCMIKNHELPSISASTIGREVYLTLVLESWSPNTRACAMSAIGLRRSILFFWISEKASASDSPLLFINIPLARSMIFRASRVFFRFSFSFCSATKLMGMRDRELDGSWSSSGRKGLMR